MSLAHPRSRGPVAIATCAAVAGTEPDDLQLIQALDRRGIAAEHVVWDKDDVDCTSFQLVVIRSTWDYPKRHTEFLKWAARLRRVLNPLPILRWNTDKRYLADLAARGLPVIPTRFLAPGEPFEPPVEPFVVKPAISCGAKETARYEVGQRSRACEHVQRLSASGQTVLIQPYLSAIAAAGEVALNFIGGAYSHSVRRGPVLKQAGVVRGGETVASNIRAYEASPAELALAQKALGALPCAPADLLYARVDLAPGPAGEPLILEVELTEPSLFLGFSESAAERLAQAIASALAAG